MKHNRVTSVIVLKETSNTIIKASTTDYMMNTGTSDTMCTTTLTFEGEKDMHAITTASDASQQRLFIASSTFPRCFKQINLE